MKFVYFWLNITPDWLDFVTTPSRGELVRYGVVVNKLKFDESDSLQFSPHGFPPSRGELCICISCFDWLLFLPHKFRSVFEGCEFSYIDLIG